MDELGKDGILNIVSSEKDDGLDSSSNAQNGKLNFLRKIFKRKSVKAIFVLAFFLFSIVSLWSARKTLAKVANELGIYRAIRATGIAGKSVPGYFEALTSQNLLYDYNSDGVVSGEDYSSVVAASQRAKITPTPTLSVTPIPTMAPPGEEQILVGDNPATAQDLVLPSTRSFGTDTFNGAATVSYPIEIPPYKANLSPGLALSYSSATVDGLYTGTKTKWRNDANHPYQRQAGIFGLGWNMAFGGEIVRDTNGTFDDTADDKFILAFSGGSANLLKESGDDIYSVWRTVPNLNLKIERYGRCYVHAYSGGSMNICRYLWIITDGVGTKSYFGYPSTVDNWHRTNDPDNSYFGEGSGKDWYPLLSADGTEGYTSWLIYGSTKKGYHALTTRWLLYQSESIYDQGEPPCGGCEVEVNYRYLFELGDSHNGTKYVKAEYPLNLTYGNQKVTFERETRFDTQTHVGDNTGGEQKEVSNDRIKKIVVRSLDKTLRVYKFEYIYGWDPGKHHDNNGNGIPESGEIVGGQVVHSLLNKITVYTDETENSLRRLPSYVFSYGNDCSTFKGGCPLTAYTSDQVDTQARTANDFFLVTADNGFKGKVTYEYYESGGSNALEVKYCDPDKADRNGNTDCRQNHAFNTQRHRIQAVITDDGIGNTVRTEYNYTGAGATLGLAYVKGYGEEWYDGQNCCVVKDAICQSGNPSGCKCPGSSNTCYQGGEWDCAGGTQCGWDDVTGGLCCPTDLPNAYSYRCLDGRDGNRYRCSTANPNVTCYSNCKYRSSPFTGYEFLGYPEVETIVYEKGSDSEVAAKSWTQYYQALDTASCFKPSPLKGTLKASKNYDAGNTSKYALVEEGYTVRFGTEGGYTYVADSDLNTNCSTYDPEVSVALVQQTRTYARSYYPSPSLCTLKTTSYNTDKYALPYEVKDWGEVDCSTWTIDIADGTRIARTDYTSANEDRGMQPKPKETWTSDAANTVKYNHTKTYYDGGNGEIGDYGNVVKTGIESVVDGVEAFRETTYEYSTTYPWQLSATTDPLGRRTTTQYDSTHRSYPTSVTNAKNQTVTTEYDFNTGDANHPNKGDVFGVPVKVTDANGNKTYFEYDDFGRLTKTFLPGKTPWDNANYPDTALSYFYFNKDDIPDPNCIPSNSCMLGLGVQGDGYNRPKMLTVSATRYADDGDSGKLNETHSYYDGEGKTVQTRQIWHENNYTSTGIPVDGVLKDIVSAKTYTSLGQTEYQSLSYLADPWDSWDNGRLRVTYDDRNFVTDPNIKKISYAYDDFGRLSTTTYPDGSKEESQYEVDGNPLKTKFSDKNCKAGDGSTPCAEKYTTSDAFGQTVEVKEVDGGTNYINTFEYDPVLGIQTKIKDTQGNVTSQIEYDKLGRKTKIWDIDMSPEMTGDTNSWRYEYDALGNLKKQTNPKGVVAELVYDSLNRLDTKTVSGVKILDNNYDTCTNGKGRICSVLSFDLHSEDQIEQVDYTYDAKGLVSQETVSYSNLPNAQVNGQIATTLTYDGGGRIKTETSAENSALGIPEETINYYYNRPYLDSVVTCNLCFGNFI